MTVRLVGRENELRRARNVLDEKGVVLIAGPSGIGKTALVDVLAAEWKQRGGRVVEVRGTQGLRNVPFGALTLSLNIGSAQSSEETLTRVTANLVEDDLRALVVVDDTHLVDSESAAVISGLAQVADVAVVMAITSGESVSSDITSVWARWPGCRLEVGSLSDEEVGELVESLMGEPLQPAVAEMISTVTLGYPLYVISIANELIANRPEPDADISEWVAAVSGSADRLVRLMERRLARLGRDERRLFDVVAFAESAPMSIIAGAEDMTALEGLHAAGLIRVSDDRVQVAHPLLGSVARETLTADGRRACAQRLIDALDDSVDRGDAALVVRNAIAVGVIPEVDDLVIAAEVALGWGDYAGVGRITELAPDDAALKTIRARAARFLGEVPDTEIPAGLDEDSLTEFVSGTAQGLAYAERRFSDAIEFLRTGMVRVEGRQNRNRLALELMILSALVGDLDALLGASRAAASNSDPDTKLLAVASTQLAEALTLSTASADETYEEGLKLAENSGAMLAEQLEMSRVMVDLAEGRFSQALQRSSAFDQKTIPGSWATVESVVADAWLAPTKAAELADRAVELLQEFDPLANLAQARFVADMRRAQLGNRPIEDDASPHEEGVALIDQVMARRADAWWAWVDGDSTAGKRLIEVGREAIAMGHRFWGLCALMDATRLGYGDDVVSDIEQLIITRGAGLALLAGQDARAQTLDEYWVVTTGWWAAGAPIYAIESALRAPSHDDPLLSVAIHLMASQGAEPVIGDLDPVSNPISDRQMEIVVGALRGGSNDAIAEELFISRRTVENHLHHVYSTLGFEGGREELAATYGWIFRDTE